MRMQVENLLPSAGSLMELNSISGVRDIRNRRNLPDRN